MSYQVIARKYRPQRFADVVGQEHVTGTLSNAIEQKRIAHAYLFCGPRGTGKTTVARIFAKCLNCTGGPRLDFDDNDPRCREITEGRAMDVLEIDGASNNGVDQVRELRETAQYAPASSKFKIYIIDEVHMLTTAAFNALLKTLEEPPAHVKFMFATTDPEKVLPTILSRCQRFDLRRIPSALIVKHLNLIATLEKVKVDEPALAAIARGADGGMRDAESTLDQLISFCGNEIVEADVLSMFGLTSRAQVLSLAGAVLAGDQARVLKVVDELVHHGKDLNRLLADLLGHFRNLLIYVVSRGDLSLVEASEAEVAALAEQSAGVRAEALTRILEVISEGEGRLRDAVSKKISLEVALMRAIQARNAISLDVVLRQLQQLRGEEPPGGPPPGPRSEAPVNRAQPSEARTTPAPNGPSALVTPPALQETAPSAPTRIAGTEPAAPMDLDALWSALLEAIGRASPFTRSYLVKAFPVSFSRNVLTIGFDTEFAEYLPLVDNAKNHAILHTKLKELGQGEVQFKFVRSERSGAAGSAPAAPVPSPATSPVVTNPSAAPGKPASAPTPSATEPKADKPKFTKLDPADFKNDPLIRQALEVFKGQIVEVRG